HSSNIMHVYIIVHKHMSSLLPYTTLFRSPMNHLDSHASRLPFNSLSESCVSYASIACRSVSRWVMASTRISWTTASRWTSVRGRSEEHTSELQSRENLVCRLLLEKKKRTN